jgi:hypothetical protein
MDRDLDTGTIRDGYGCCTAIPRVRLARGDDVKNSSHSWGRVKAIRIYLSAGALLYRPSHGRAGGEGEKSLSRTLRDEGLLRFDLNGRGGRGTTGINDVDLLPPAAAGCGNSEASPKPTTSSGLPPHVHAPVVS